MQWFYEGIDLPKDVSGHFTAVLHALQARDADFLQELSFREPHDAQNLCCELSRYTKRTCRGLRLRRLTLSPFRALSKRIAKRSAELKKGRGVAMHQTLHRAATAAEAAVARTKETLKEKACKAREHYHASKTTAQTRGRGGTCGAGTRDREPARTFIPRAVIKGVVADLTGPMTEGRRVTYRAEAIAALHGAAEAFMVEFFADCNLLAKHARRVSVKLEDMALEKRLVSHRPSSERIIEEALAEFLKLEHEQCLRERAGRRQAQRRA